MPYLSSYRGDGLAAHRGGLPFAGALAWGLGKVRQAVTRWGGGRGGDGRGYRPSCSDHPGHARHTHWWRSSDSPGRVPTRRRPPHHSGNPSYGSHGRTPPGGLPPEQVVILPEGRDIRPGSLEVRTDTSSQLCERSCAEALDRSRSGLRETREGLPQVPKIPLKNLNHARTHLDTIDRTWSHV